MDNHNHTCVNLYLEAQDGSVVYFHERGLEVKEEAEHVPDKNPRELLFLEAGTGWKAAASVEFFKLQDPSLSRTQRSQVS